MRGATLYQYFFLDFFFLSRFIHSPVHLLRKQELWIPLFLNPGKKKRRKNSRADSEHHSSLGNALASCLAHYGMLPLSLRSSHHMSYVKA